MTTEIQENFEELPTLIPRTLFEVEITGQIPEEHIGFFEELFRNVLKRETDAILHTAPKVTFKTCQ
jgi:hypothetical protein